MTNPFRYSGPITKEDPESATSFVERTMICRTTLRLLQQGEYVQIIGPHQSGRTTLAIDLIGKLLPKPEDVTSRIPVLISCESLMDASRECLISLIVSRLRRVMKEYLTEEKHANLNSILAKPIPKTILHIHDFLVTFGDNMRESTKFSEIVFFLDEIEGLPNNLVVGVLRLFRALFHYYAECRWESPYRVVILTTNDLSYWHLGKSSPYNISGIVLLDPFSSQELDILLDERHVGQALDNVTFSDSSKLRIYEETGGHPYLIQRLCHILVERTLTKPGPVVLTDKDVIEGVLELFEKGDKNLRNLYCEAAVGSEEWQLYQRLAAGQREPFERDNLAIGTLAQLGAISDVDHYCRISARIYERQILKRHFWEAFTHVAESFAEKERLLLHVSCLQKILLSDQIEQLVFARIEDLTPDDDQIEVEIDAQISDYLDRVLKDRESDFDMEEIFTFVDYYKMERVEGREEVLSLLVKAFIGRFNEIAAAE